MGFPSTKRRYSWGSLVEQEIDDEENGVESEIDGESENDVGSENYNGSEKDDGSENDSGSGNDDGLEKDAEPQSRAAPEKHVGPENDARSEYAEPEGEGGPEDDEQSSSTATNRSYAMYSITSSMASPTKFGRQSSMWLAGLEKTKPWPFVFEFDEVVGELGPNERRNLRLSFRPTSNLTYTADATCYLTCDRDDYPKIVNALPVTIDGTGCRTQFQVSLKTVTINHCRVYKLLKYFLKTYLDE